MKRSLALLTFAFFALTSIVTSAPQCPLQELTSHNPATNRQLGRSAAIDGDTAILGAPGGVLHSAYVFERNLGGPNAWGERVRLLHPPIVPGSSGFGDDVAISGDTILVGAPLDDDGYAWVFERDFGGPDNWGNSGQLVALDVFPNSFFGRSVAIEGDRAVVGRIEGSAGTGSAFVFERAAGIWSQVVKLSPSLAATKSFGFSLALHGDSLLVGAPGADLAYLFERDSSGTWNEIKSFDDGMPLLTTSTGIEVALGDGLAAVSQPRRAINGLLNAGAIQVYERNFGGPGNWGLALTLTAPVPGKNHEFGTGLSLWGDVIAGGAPFDSTVSPHHGAVHMYRRSPGTGGLWGHLQTLEAPSVLASDTLGYSVALQGATLVAGAPRSKTGGIGRAVFFGGADPTNYCTAGVSASGCMATIAGSGPPSATAAFGFDLQVTGVEGSKRGLFFFGSNGRQAIPWGNSSSFQCVVPPVARTPLFQETGTTGACDGAYSFDLSAYLQLKPHLNPGAGAVVQAQFWYRDPFAANKQRTAISDALEFVLCP